MKMRKILSGALTIIAGSLLISSTAGAYQFFEADSGGCRWTSIGAGNLDFVVDKSSTDAIGDSLLADFTTVKNTWHGVEHAKDMIGNLTKSAGDFTRANFASTWGKGFEVGGAVDGVKEVVLDETGKIFTEVFSVDPSSIFGLGLTKKNVAGGGCNFTDAALLINGSPSVPASGDSLATSVHEMGHVLGLAHSSVAQYNSRNNRAFSGGTSSPSPALDVININSAPTMYPFSLPDDTQGRTLEADDKAGIAELYPEATFATSLGVIQGKVNRCSDATDFLEGVNVRVVNTSNSTVQLTRYTKFDGPADDYIIRGVPPGNYRVIVEAMGFNGHTKGRMAIQTNLDQGFPTEYYGPTEDDEANCNEDTPSAALPVEVAAAGTKTVNIRVEDGIDLAMVVDDTGSMSREISAVRESLQRTVDSLEASDEEFPKVTIITFKDNVTQRIVSDDPAELRTVISGLRASGGGDCPESSNAAVYEAAKIVKRGGRAILFTDADSRPDGVSTRTVLDLLRERGVRLSVLLSATCSSSFSGLTPMDMPSSPETLIASQGKPVNLPPQAPVAMSASGSVARVYEEPEPLGRESADETNFTLATESGGVFLAVPRPSSGTDAAESYINVATSLAISSVIPAVGTVTPLAAPQGATLEVIVKGSNTSWFEGGSTLTFPGTGITVDSQTVTSATEIRAVISIPASEPTAFVDVRVTTDLGGGTMEVASSAGGFQVKAPSGFADVVSITPAEGFLGQTQTISIRGFDLSFDSNTLVDLGSGVTIDSITVVSSTELSVQITISESASTGLRNLRVYDNVALNVTENRAFQVSELPPAIARITSLSETTGIQGQTGLTMTIQGINTNFDNTSTASFGSGITVMSLTVRDATTIDAVVDIAPDASLTSRDVSVSTGDEAAVILNGFRVVQMPVSISGGTITSMQGIDPSSIAGGTGRPSDIRYLVGFNIATNSVGGTVTLSLTLPNAAPSGTTWWKYLASRTTWMNFSSNATFSADRRTVTLTLVDGGVGDDDGVANGVIVDPSGLAGSSSTSGGGSSGGEIDDDDINFVVPSNPKSQGTTTIITKKSGMGCSYMSVSGQSGFDPVFPLSLIVAAYYLLRRKRLEKGHF